MWEAITKYDEERTINLFKKEAFEEGLNKGRNEGKIETLASLANQKLITVEKAASEAGMTVDEFLQKMTLY